MNLDRQGLDLRSKFILLKSIYRQTLRLRAFGFFKIPLLFFVSPTVLQVSQSRCVIRIRLSRRTQNHLHSMYFGALAIGADCAGGLIAFNEIEQAGGHVSLIFKDFHADFLKRAEGDVLFTCEDGLAIRQLVQKAVHTGERQNMPVHITATVDSLLKNTKLTARFTGARLDDTEVVAKFVMTLSLKRRIKN